VELTKLLRSVEIFAGLSGEQLSTLANIFTTHQLKEGEVLFSQGDEASDLFLVSEGFVEVVREATEEAEGKVIVNLGPGQSVGEMALVDRGTRSATIRAVTDDTVVVSMSSDNFEKFCEENTEIGYRIMRNIAADLSFRLRRRD
jgi:CRP/FNR family cyclic AMP-dependent transcriptional regulator